MFKFQSEIGDVWIAPAKFYTEGNNCYKFTRGQNILKNQDKFIRFSNLLHNYEKLRGEKLKLEEELAALKSQHSQNKKEIDEWREECSSLKLANSVLGSDDYKRETKLKINELVREIDKCISQLSE